uniref:Uncharacterized protein n=1 Tax=Spumella elongata TaxID=89044 RepID=A0A7S3LZL8_9STRA
MWLNQIITKHVDLSRGELSLLGGVPYVSLGLCGIFVMWFSTQRFFKKRIVEFKIFSLCGLAFVTLSFATLNWLLWSDESSPGHNVVLVGACMAIYGFGVGIFYMVWFGPVLGIINPTWHFLYIAISNVMFSSGATFSLSLKLILDDKTWMLSLLLLQAAMLIQLITFAFWNHKTVFQPEVEQPPSVSADIKHNSQVVKTRQFLRDLFFFRRNFSSAQLLQEVCDLTSKQFYLLCIAHMLVNGTSTTFMANLGPLISNDSDTDGSDRDQLVVLILSTVGQCFGRALVPVITYYVVHHLEPVPESQKNIAKVVSLRESRLLNRTTLPFTLAIGIIFTVSLLCVQLVPHVQFVAASTFFSMGYGAMWCVTSSFPSFFTGQDFSFVMSFQQVLGSLSTLVCVVIVAASQFDNTETFFALLVMSIATMVAATLLLTARLSAEPSQDALELYVRRKYKQETDDHVETAEDEQMETNSLLHS